MILILAGTQQQARDWAKDNNLNPATYKIIRNVEDTFKHHPEYDDFELVGTWWASDQIRDIIDYLMTTHWKYQLEKKFNE
jgi:hypothetical protein